MADNRRLRLLELKRAANLASATELTELREAYTTVGEGLVVPLGRLTGDEFDAKFAGDWIERAGD